jgi:hypothetical protein
MVTPYVAFNDGRARDPLLIEPIRLGGVHRCRSEIPFV